MNTFAVSPSPQTEQNNLLGRTTAGYQTWFHAGNDLDASWGHWSHGTAPEEGNVHTEMYPDFDEYPVLYPTRLPNYPDGRPAAFYEGHDPTAIDVHFRWMKEYGVDGVGIQRFYGTTSAETQPEPTHLTAIMKAAEAHERIFYVMYDTSGCGRDTGNIVPRMQGDVIHNVEEKGLIASPAYAHAGGKPVICIWGLAPTEPGRYPPAAEAVELIEWLKERGYFVIGGLPDNAWAEETGEYAAVYAALDMISPWTPGRFRLETLGAWIDDHLARDLAYCTAHGKEYQPVMHSGFAWSNFGGGGNPNATPREAGQFLWEQAKRYAAAGVRNGYFAMFDEYDEATAIAKAAPDSYAIPTGEVHFQTLSADGTWLSSDFYLRLAGAVTATLRGEHPITEEVPVPHSEGPVYWRNGFEMREAQVTAGRGNAMDKQRRPVDVCDAHALVLEQDAVQLETAAVIKGMRGDVCYTGRYGFAFTGIGMTAGRCRVYYRLAKTEIPVTEGLTLSYRMRALNECGDKVGVDLLLDDGTRLSEHCPAVLEDKHTLDEELFRRGNFRRYRWTKIEQALPAELYGRTIKAVLVAYDAPGEARFGAYIDDIILSK